MKNLKHVKSFNEATENLNISGVINRFDIDKKLEELKKLNTKNLLRFYKAERKRFWSGEPTENFSMDDWSNFLYLIKQELDSRENVS